LSNKQEHDRIEALLEYLRPKYKKKSIKGDPVDGVFEVSRQAIEEEAKRKTVEIDVAIGPDEYITIKAYKTASSGLVVHRVIDAENGWAVTHLRSGQTVCPLELPSKKQAMECAAALADLVDWTQPGEEITLNFKYRTVAEIFERHQS
jgi:hypothetical protein